MTTKPTIARVWRGRTRRDVADTYEPYLRAEGIPPLQKVGRASVKANNSAFWQNVGFLGYVQDTDAGDRKKRWLVAYRRSCLFCHARWIGEKNFREEEFFSVPELIERVMKQRAALGSR